MSLLDSELGWTTKLRASAGTAHTSTAIGMSSQSGWFTADNVPLLLGRISYQPSRASLWNFCSLALILATATDSGS